MSSQERASMRTVVYSPQAILRDPRTLLKEMGRDLLRGRELAWRLAVRDIRAQYRASFLSYLWAFLTPLATTTMWVFMSATGVVKVAVTDMPYPAFVFSGTMLWQILTEAITAPQTQISSSQSMLVKLNFPRESLIMAGVLKVLFSVLVKTAILVPAILLFGVVPDWHLVLFPLAMLALVVVGTAIGLLLVPIGTLYSDVGRIVPMGMQFLMYLTPVVYALPKIGMMATLIHWNPFTPLIMTGRAWLTGSARAMPMQFLVVLGTSFLLLLLGWVLFRLAMTVLVERMGS
jgi:lipopolysaccharide transport system permease protein